MASSDTDDEPQQQQPEAPKPLLDNKDLPSIFWDSMPENPEEHPDYQAFQALEEECTPEERAESLKNNGNKKLQMGLKARNKLLLREAVVFYEKGLAIQCPDQKLNAALNSNAAHVESLLGNWRKSLTFALAAVKLDSSNVKAHFRAARAALKLKRHERAVSLAQEGLQLHPGTAELESTLKEASAALEVEQAALRERRAKQEEAHAAAAALADAILSRGYQVTTPEMSVDNRKPYLDEGGLLHWPMLLFYPEGMQQDVVEDCCEGDSLAQHLDVMFAPDAPPLEWDFDREYTRERVELYYLSHAGAPLSRDQLIEALQGRWPEGAANQGPSRYGDKAALWMHVDERRTLQQVMTCGDYVVPGVALFFVVAKGTQYREEFLAQKLNR